MSTRMMPPPSWFPPEGRAVCERILQELQLPRVLEPREDPVPPAPLELDNAMHRALWREGYRARLRRRQRQGPAGEVQGEVWRAGWDAAERELGGEG